MAIARESSPPPGWDPQGIASLLGAFPHGQLSEIVGRPSSGGSSLLLALLARATAEGRLVALVDGTDAFDPAVAAAAGADLEALLWVRCGGRLASACRAADLLARCPGVALVALDVGELGLGRRLPVPPATWLRLQRAVRGSATTLILRTPRHLAGSAAALVLELARGEARWIGSPRPTRLGGLGCRVHALHRRGAFRPESGGPWTVQWRL